MKIALESIGPLHYLPHLRIYPITLLGPYSPSSAHRETDPPAKGNVQVSNGS
jgi:hypothetical protein